MKDRKYYVEIKCDCCGRTYKKSKYRLEEKNFCRSCNMKRTYSENPKILKDALEKRKKTCKEKYGVENVAQNIEIHKKMLNTQLERHGTKQSAHHYIFNNECFDSSWELAYYIYLMDNKIDFLYQPDTPLEYLDENKKKRLYYPDFLVNGEFQEIKGNQFFNENGEPYNMYKKEFWWEKYNLMLSNNIKIIRQDEALKYVKYVNKKYGIDFLKNCRK